MRYGLSLPNVGPTAELLRLTTTAEANSWDGVFLWDHLHLRRELHLDVVDRMSAEVMRGFSAVPKRGAEVGGILLGSIEPGEVTIVRVEDFEAVPCSYSRGPSYLFSEEEQTAFEEALARWPGDPLAAATPVGYFRSHTREGMSLAAEDLNLLSHYFRDPAQIALLVKPFATKVSIAGFFVREGGEFPAETPLEFPFRRREITGEPPPPRRTMDRAASLLRIRWAAVRCITRWSFASRRVWWTPDC